jgi:hypothetical protein
VCSGLKATNCEQAIYACGYRRAIVDHYVVRVWIIRTRGSGFYLDSGFCAIDNECSIDGVATDEVHSMRICIALKAVLRDTIECHVVLPRLEDE